MFFLNLTKNVYCFYMKTTGQFKPIVSIYLTLRNTHTHLQFLNAKCLFWVYTNLRKSFIQLVKQTKWNKTEIPHEATELINKIIICTHFSPGQNISLNTTELVKRKCFDILNRERYIKHIDNLKTLNKTWCFRCFLYNF